MKKRKILIIMLMVAALVGIVASVESTLAHYDPSISEFCNINSQFDCDVVNTGPYSEILGIPVAILGLLAYSFMFVAGYVYARSKNEVILNAITGTAVLGFFFSLYLTSLEAFVIKTWCLVCLTQQVAIAILLIATLWLRFGNFNSHNPNSLHE